MRRKVFVLGLDGATFDLIKLWADEGELPVFRELISSGTWGRLRSMIRPITPVAWTSMMTGKNPGKHGMVDFYDMDHDNFNIPHYKNAKDVKAEFLWETLEENRIRCGIINIPLSSPFRSKISFGEGDHLRKDWMNFSWPEDTKAGLNSANPLFEKRMLELIDLRFDQMEDIIENKEWDFFAINVFAIDPLQHFRWHDKDLLLKGFKKVDKRLGGILKMLEDTNLFVVSDHGMTGVEKRFYVNRWLQEKGYLRVKEGGIKPSIVARMGLNHELFCNLMDPLKTFLIKSDLSRFLPLAIRDSPRKLRKKIPSRSIIRMDELKNKIEWGETTAYSVGSYGGIFINLKSRSKDGSVKEENYEAIKNKLKKELREYFEGECEVYEKEKIYSGPFSKEAADLMIYIKDGKILPDSSYILNSGIFDVPKKGLETTGNHSVEGIFIAHGPDILRKGRIENLSIMDITPTILHMFGLPIPKDMDGKVLDILRSKNKVVYQDISERERVRRRIKNLKL